MQQCLLISLFFGVFFLKETMPGKTDHKDYGIVVGEAMKSLYRKIFHKESASGYASLQEEDLGNEVSNQLEPPTPKTPGFGVKPLSPPAHQNPSSLSPPAPSIPAKSLSQLSPSASSLFTTQHLCKSSPSSSQLPTLRTPPPLR
jgi:hypothetical protein